jgi:Ca2+-binding RTX toxin-like protein
VSFTNPGGDIAVTLSSGTYTFTSSGGSAGTSDVSGTVSGISVPVGTTLTLNATAAGSIAFTGSGTAVVVAGATGEDLSAMTATGLDIIQLTSGQNYTLTTSQLPVARIGTTGTLGNIIDTGKMTVIGSLDSVSGTASTALKAAGADVVVGLATTPGDITIKSITGVDRIDLLADQSYVVTESEAKLLGLAPGTETVTIANSAPSGITLDAAVENFVLSNFPGNVVVQGAAGQSITGGSSADKVTAITGVTSTSDLKAGANIVVVTAGTDISKGTFLATGGTLTYNVDAATTATMTVAQTGAIGSATGTQNITLGSVATGLTLRTDIETYTLGNFTNSVVMSDVAQKVVGGTGADTVTAIDGVTSANDLGAGANVVVVPDGADLSGGSFTATGGTLDMNLSGDTTATLSAAEAANITSATGTQTVTVANAATSLNLAAAVENWVLGNFTNSVTLKAAGQNVTGGTGTDTISTAAVAATGTLDGGTGTNDTLSVGGTLGAATITNFDTLNVSANANITAANAGAALGPALLTMASSTGLTMTVAQNEGLKNSTAVSGTGQTVTLLDAGSTKAIAGVETYVLAAGANTIATSTAGQTINANALTDAQVLTLTGSVAATVTLVAGDLAAGAYTGSLTVTATTGTNVITTGSGADTVTGGSGSDTITLGTGADVYVFNSLTGTDTITDFSASLDKCDLSKATFTGLGSVGVLGASAFESGAGLTAAATAAGRIVYDTSTGDLYYDSDGSGGAAAVMIGVLTGAPAISATNFVIIS